MWPIKLKSTSLYRHQLSTTVLIRCCAMALPTDDTLKHDNYFSRKLNLPIRRTQSINLESTFRWKPPRAHWGQRWTCLQGSTGRGSCPGTCRWLHGRRTLSPRHRRWIAAHLPPPCRGSRSSTWPAPWYSGHLPRLGHLGDSSSSAIGYHYSTGMTLRLGVVLGSTLLGDQRMNASLHWLSTYLY